MNRHFAEVDGKPSAVTPAHTNLGLAIDLLGKDGNRQLVVAGIKNADTMRFGQFIAAYEDIVRRARDGKLTAEDFAGVKRKDWFALGLSRIHQERCLNY